MQFESSTRLEQTRNSNTQLHAQTHPHVQRSPRYSQYEERDCRDTAAAAAAADSAWDNHSSDRQSSIEGSMKRSLVLDLNSVRDELRSHTAPQSNGHDHRHVQGYGQGQGHGGESLPLSLSKMTPYGECDRFTAPSVSTDSMTGPGTGTGKGKAHSDGDILSEYQEYCLEVEYEKYLQHFRREQERVAGQIRVQREFFKGVNTHHASSSSSSSSAYPSSFHSDVSTHAMSSPKSEIRGEVRGSEKDLVDTLRVAKVALDLSQSDMLLTNQRMLELTMRVDLLQQENRNLKYLRRAPGPGPGPGPVPNLDPNSSSYSSSYSHSGTRMKFKGYSG